MSRVIDATKSLYKLNGHAIRIFTYLILLVGLTACPAYDPPPEEILTVVNKSNSVIYLILNQNPELPGNLDLRLYYDISNRKRYPDDDKKPKIILPHYAVDSFQTSEIPLDYILSNSNNWLKKDSFFLFVLTKEKLLEKGYENLSKSNEFDRMIVLKPEMFQNDHGFYVCEVSF